MGLFAGKVDHVRLESLWRLLLGFVKEAPPPVFFISLGLMVVPLGLMGLWMLYGLWGALRAFQGRDFRYIVLGRMLERYLGQEGKTSE